MRHVIVIALVIAGIVLLPIPQTRTANEGILIFTKEPESIFANYVKMRESHGYNVYFQNLKDLTGENDRIDKDIVRKKILQAKKTKNVTNIILVGDMSLIPMPLGSPSSLEGGLDADLVDTPTDYYYATSSSNWDKDGDGRIGEYEDDGVVNYLPDVAVGRLPFNETTNVANALNSIVKFENLPDFMKAKAFFAGAMLGYKGELWNDVVMERTDGSQFLEDLYNDFLKKDGFSRYRMYEKSGFSPSPYECEEEINNQNMAFHLSETYGLTVWTAHGSSSGIVRHIWKDNPTGRTSPDKSSILQTQLLSSSDVNGKNTNWGIVVSASCCTSNPGSGSNLGATFIKNGAVGYVGATRVAWSPSYWRVVEDGGMDTILYLFIQNLTKGMSAGWSLAMAHHEFANKYFYGDIEDPVEASQMNIFNFNLYGDPAVKIFREKHGKNGKNPDYCNLVLENPTSTATQGGKAAWTGIYEGSPGDSFSLSVLPSILDDGKVKPEITVSDGKWQVSSSIPSDSQLGNRKWFLYIKQNGHESKLFLNLNVVQKENADLIGTIDIKKHAPFRPFKLTYAIPNGIRFVEMSIKYNPHQLQIKSAKLAQPNLTGWLINDNWFGMLLIKSQGETNKNFLEITFIPTEKFKSTKIEVASIKPVGSMPEPLTVNPAPIEISTTEDDQWRSLADFDKSGYVDRIDLGIISGKIGITKAHPKWNPVFDLNGDLRIDLADYKLTLSRLSN
jgi:hypothetical protein